MAIIITLGIILACVGLQLVFSSLARSTAMLLSAIAASFISLNFYESLAAIMIDSSMMAPKAHGVAMLLIFVLSFGILVALSTKFLSGEIKFEGLVDRIGGAVVGLFTGYVISGIIILSLSLASGSGSFPYERFSGKPDMQNPSGTLLSPDGFQAAMFGFISDGSLAGSNSFAVLHAGINDTAALDRMAAEKKISPLAGKNPFQGAPVLWAAPAGLLGPDGKKLESAGGTEMLLLRLTVPGGADSSFLLGQLRLVCRSKDAKGSANTGSGTCIYPAGYLKDPTTLVTASADTVIPPADLGNGSGAKVMDFAFYVPGTMKPALIELKRNWVVAASISDAKELQPVAEPEKPKEKKAAEPNSPM
jgi:hypothetical protein